MHSLVINRLIKTHLIGCKTYLKANSKSGKSTKLTNIISQNTNSKYFNITNINFSAFQLKYIKQKIINPLKEDITKTEKI